MKTLTENQIEFILEHFFKNEKFAGWRGIARKLIIDGECIVAGDSCIWYGGIGNFIKTETTQEAIGCLKYTFDLDVFLTSVWYKEIKEYFLNTEESNREIILEKYNKVIEEFDKHDILYDDIKNL